MRLSWRMFCNACVRVCVRLSVSVCLRPSVFVFPSVYLFVRVCARVLDPARTPSRILALARARLLVPSIPRSLERARERESAKIRETDRQTDRQRQREKRQKEKRGDRQRESILFMYMCLLFVRSLALPVCLSICLLRTDVIVVRQSLALVGRGSAEGGVPAPLIFPSLLYAV